MKVEKSGIEEKHNKKRDKGTRSMRIGTQILVVFLVLYIPSLINWMYGSNAIIDILRMGTLEDSVNTEGYFIRDEVLLDSPFTGNCIVEVGEGDKVPRGFKVATVLNPNYVDLIERLNEVELEILAMQKEIAEKEEFFSEDILKIDKNIEEKIRLVAYESSNNSFLDIKSIKDSINELMLKKAEIMGNVGTPGELLAAKKQEKQNLLNNINANKKEVISAEAGLISFSIDGYESILRPENIESLTPQMLEEIKIKQRGKIVNNLSVHAGKPFAKVIRGLDCQIAVVLDEGKLSDVKKGDRVIVRVNELGRNVKGRVSYRSQSFDDKYILAININEAINETTHIRRANVDIIRCTNDEEGIYRGLKVPMSSLIDVDIKEGAARIVLVKANRASIRDVEIIMHDAEYAIIKSPDKTQSGTVNLYDSYVVNPENIQEGQVIN